jgi:nitrite reductase (NO-forming)
MKDIPIVSSALLVGIVGGSLFATTLFGPPSATPRATTQPGSALTAPPAPGAPGVIAVGPGVPAVAAPAIGSLGTTAQAAQAKPERQSAAPELRPLPPVQIAAPLGVREPTLVKYEVETRDVTALMDDGVAYTFWTFGDSVPGPMLRVRQGDTIELTLKNAPDSKLTHSIDLHAVTGPGGGAKVTQVAPGESATFRFQALNPGVYVYHCATPMVPHHVASGMYGLIVVEPPEGLPPVDREFYVMQGDFYLDGAREEKGHHEFALDEMLDEKPDYVLFNGGVGALAGENALKANVGETVRIFFGVGGPNVTSSFHVIGEIFDRVQPEGASQVQTNVQTTLVPAGGATIVEFKLDVPGTYILVDHSLGRLVKGAAAMLDVSGPENAEVFQPVQVPAHSAAKSGH